MKFGKQIKRLAAPKHLNHYLAYDVLKKAINVVFAADGVGGDIKADLKAVDDEFGQSTHALSGARYRPPDSRFHELLQHELSKVNRFAMLQLRMLVDTLREAHRPLVMHAAETEIPEDVLSTAERLLDTAAAQLVELEHYRQLNHTGFRKIVKKFDKRASSSGWPAGSLRSWFLGQLHREFFAAVNFDSHLLALAWGYASIRRHRSGRASKPPQQVHAAASPASEEPQNGTATEVFWLQPRLGMRTLCTLVKWFDIATTMSGGELTAASLAEQQRRLLLSLGSEGTTLLPSRLAAFNTLRYYDETPTFPAYTSRVRLGDDSSSRAGFRVRRTAPFGVAMASEVVERDGDACALASLPFTTTPASSSGEAFPIKANIDASDVQSLIQSAAAVSKEAHRSAFAREVEQAASRPNFEAVATVNSSRWVFRGDTADTHGVTIALDEDLQISHASSEDVLDFPYSLLEVASVGGARASGAWLKELRSHAALRDVADFSIGVHAVAALHKEKLLELSAQEGKGQEQLPHWQEHVSHAQLDYAEAAGPPEWRRTYSEDMARSPKGKASVSPAFFDSSLLPAPAAAPSAPVRATAPATARPSGGGNQDNLASDTTSLRVTGERAAVATAAAPAVKHIEPKNYLASERTMLEWMHTVLALAFLSLGLWKVSLRTSLTAPASVDADISAATIVIVTPAPSLLNSHDASQMALGCYSLALVLVAVAFAWYAAFAHSRRLDALMAGKHRESMFNGRLAPTLFACCVGLALVVHLLVQIVPVWLALGATSDVPETTGASATPTA